MPTERQHGTRAKYVAEKCRCDECRKANRDYANERTRVRAELAKTLERTTKPVKQKWVPKGHTKKLVRQYSRGCTGVNGKPCPHKTHLRKDSKGPICNKCREQLLKRVTLKADTAREHLLRLQARGIGLGAVHEASGVNENILRDIRKGRQSRILPDTQERILNVDETLLLDHSYVPADEAWRLINEMLATGVTKGAISKMIGNNGKALQVRRDRILAKTLFALRKAHKEVMEIEAIPDVGYTICPECCLSHAKEDRFLLLRRMLPNDTETIVDAFPCIYGIKKVTEQHGKSARYRMLVRDLNEIGAKVVRRGRHGSTIWDFPEVDIPPACDTVSSTMQSHP